MTGKLTVITLDREIQSLTQHTFNNERQEWEDNSAWSIGITPRGCPNPCVIVGSNAQRLFVWHLFTIPPFPNNHLNSDHGHNIPSVDISSDGQLVATASIDQHVRVLKRALQDSQCAAPDALTTERASSVQRQWGWSVRWCSELYVYRDKRTLQQKEQQLKRRAQARAEEQKRRAQARAEATGQRPSNTRTAVNSIVQLLGYAAGENSLVMRLVNMLHQGMEQENAPAPADQDMRQRRAEQRQHLLQEYQQAEEMHEQDEEDEDDEDEDEEEEVEEEEEEEEEYARVEEVRAEDGNVYEDEDEEDDDDDDDDYFVDGQGQLRRGARVDYEAADNSIAQRLMIPAMDDDEEDQEEQEEDQNTPPHTTTIRTQSPTSSTHTDNPCVDKSLCPPDLLLYTTKSGLFLLDSNLRVLHHVPAIALDTLTPDHRFIDRLAFLEVIPELSILCIASSASDRVLLYRIVKYSCGNYRLEWENCVPVSGSGFIIKGMSVGKLSMEGRRDERSVGWTGSFPAPPSCLPMSITASVDCWALYILYSDNSLVAYQITRSAIAERVFDITQMII